MTSSGTRASSIRSELGRSSRNSCDAAPDLSYALNVIPSRSSTNASGTSTSPANAESRPALIAGSGAKRRTSSPTTGQVETSRNSDESTKPSRGGVPITTSLRTSRGSCSTSALATVPPIEWPTTTARLTRSFPSASATRLAWFSIS